MWRPYLPSPPWWQSWQRTFSGIGAVSRLGGELEGERRERETRKWNAETQARDRRWVSSAKRSVSLSREGREELLGALSTASQPLLRLHCVRLRLLLGSLIPSLFTQLSPLPPSPLVIFLHDHPPSHRARFFSPKFAPPLHALSNCQVHCFCGQIPCAPRKEIPQPHSVQRPSPCLRYCLLGNSQPVQLRHMEHEHFTLTKQYATSTLYFVEWIFKF